MRQKTKFKETEIGKISEDWEEVGFNEVVEVNPKRELNKGQTAKFVSMADIEPFKRKISNFTIKEFKGGSKFQNRDTLFARITPCLENGKTAFVDILNDEEIGFGSTEFIVLSAKKNKTDSYFVYYLSRSPDVRKVAIKSMTGTSGRQRVEHEVFDTLLINLPSLTEQSAIAKILFDLDSKIELNQQINKTLEAIGQALFKRWFVDFEFPFDFAQGKPNEKGKPYKSNGGEMVDSELGEIPKKWRIGVITDITEILSGFAFRSNDFIKYGKYRLVTIKNVQDGYFRENTKDGLEKIPQKMPEYCKLKMGDILLSLTGNVGRVCHVIGKNYLLNQRVAKLQPLKNQDYVFVYLFFRQKSILNLLENISSGTAQQNLSPIQTGNTKIFIPDRKILNNFGDTVNPLFNKILENNIQIQALSKIRDSLLPRLMSGKIRVGN